MIEEIPEPEAAPASAPTARGAEPPILTVLGEFRTASAALVFAGGLPDLADAEFGRSDRTGAWWVAAESTLAAGRELIAAAGGRVHIAVDGGFVPDRGWGDHPPTGTVPRDASAIIEADVLDVVRSAGLHPHVLPVGGDLTVLAPARRVSAIVQRALDLDLVIRTRLVRLDPLFDSDERRPGPPTMFELRLSSASGPLPAALIAALDRDATVLACRRVSDRLLLQHGLASPLPDGRLATLAAGRAGAGGWLLAGVGFGSARLTPLTEQRDGVAYVRRADQHRIPDLDEDWAAIARSAREPEPVPLTLVRARTPDAVVEAVLLDDDDLGCLPALLAGRPLADLAMLARGRDQHLMLAPGGVLERLPLGEPLYRLGPGPLFLPVGTRTGPALPPTARAALFPTTPDTALVLLPDATRVFSLAHREPVWTLWAGPPPRVDPQLPPGARRALIEVDELTTPAAPQRRSPAPRAERRRVEPSRRPAPARPRTWRDDALDAELADDLARAAELCERNGELRRAAHLYERAAHQQRSTG